MTEDYRTPSEKVEHVIRWIVLLIVLFMTGLSVGEYHDHKVEQHCEQTMHEKCVWVPVPESVNKILRLDQYSSNK